MYNGNGEFATWMKLSLVDNNNRELLKSAVNPGVDAALFRVAQGRSHLARGVSASEGDGGGVCQGTGMFISRRFGDILQETICPFSGPVLL